MYQKIQQVKVPCMELERFWCLHELMQQNKIKTEMYREKMVFAKIEYFW